jgi:hypothetical protein
MFNTPWDMAFPQINLLRDKVICIPFITKLDPREDIKKKFSSINYHNLLL